MILVIGNKNYSTWSWRAWLAMESFEIPREEILIPLDQKDTEEKIALYSPSGRVPCLLDGEVKIWDSLAIGEYLAEKFPQKKIWPSDRVARAEARAICAEMHSSFQNLRSLLTGNIRLRKKVSDLSSAASDIKRIDEIWSQCLQKYSGPFLFGEWSLADCFYAPVVLRFQTYGVPLSRDSVRYSEAILTHPAVVRLQEQAKLEPWTCPRYDKQ